MADRPCPVIDLEAARAARMERALGPARFGSLEVSGGRVGVQVDGKYTPDAARALGLALIALADEAEREGRTDG